MSPVIPPPELLWTSERIFSLVVLAIGAAIGAGTSILIARASFSRERSAAKIDAKQEESRRAQFGFVKLMQIHDLAYGGLDTITSQIERYSDPTFSKMALCQKIRGIAGLSNGLKAIELDEVSFLFRTEFPMLFSEVLKYERRIHTISEHLDLYTRERDRLIDSMEPYSYQLIDGAQHVAYANIPDDVSLVIDKKSASLDKSIERLRQELDSSVAAIRHVCESYLIAAKTCFGDEFPDVAILWEAPKELGLKYGENDANP